MSLAYSYTTDQLWADKSEFDRNQWFNRNSEELALKRGAAINALRDLAECIKATKAHEARSFSANDYVNNCIDTFDATLAPEVRSWFES
jgi:hypothetical protein